MDANRALGLPDDCREYTSVRNILRDLNVKSIQLIVSLISQYAWGPGCGWARLCMPWCMLRVHAAWCACAYFNVAGLLLRQAA